MLGRRVATVGSAWRQHAAPASRGSELLNNQRFIALLFLTPALAVLAFVVVYPFFSAIWISFHDKMIGAPAQFIGLANYRELLADPVFLRVIRNTIDLHLLRGRDQIRARPRDGAGARAGPAVQLRLAHDPVRALGGADDRRGAELPLDLRRLQRAVEQLPARAGRDRRRDLLARRSEGRDGLGRRGRRVVRHAVLHDELPRRAQGDPQGDVRGGADRRREHLARVLVHHDSADAAKCSRSSSCCR